MSETPRNAVPSAFRTDVFDLPPVDSDRPRPGIADVGRGDFGLELVRLLRAAESGMNRSAFIGAYQVHEGEVQRPNRCKGNPSGVPVQPDPYSWSGLYLGELPSDVLSDLRRNAGRRSIHLQDPEVRKILHAVGIRTIRKELPQQIDWVTCGKIRVHPWKGQTREQAKQEILEELRRHLKEAEGEDPGVGDGVAAEKHLSYDTGDGWYAEGAYRVSVTDEETTVRVVMLKACQHPREGTETYMPWSFGGAGEQYAEQLNRTAEALQADLLDGRQPLDRFWRDLVAEFDETGERVIALRDKLSGRVYKRQDEASP